MTDLFAYWVLKAFLSRILSLLKLRHGLSFVNWRAKVFMALRTYMLFWPRNNTTLFEKREYSNASKTYRWILVSWRFICSENDEKWHFVSNHSDYLHSKNKIENQSGKYAPPSGGFGTRKIDNNPTELACPSVDSNSRYFSPEFNALPQSHSPRLSN